MGIFAAFFGGVVQKSLVGFILILSGLRIFLKKNAKIIWSVGKKVVFLQPQIKRTRVV